MPRYTYDGKPINSDFDREYRRPAAWRQVKQAADGAGHRLNEAMVLLEKTLHDWCPRLALAVAAHALASMDSEARAAAWIAYNDWAATVDLAADFDEAVRKILAEPDAAAEGGVA